MLTYCYVASLLSQLSEAVAKKLKDHGAKDELYGGMMDTVASLDLSIVAKNTQLNQAVMEKLETEPERFTDVMDILEGNVNNDMLKRRVQTLKKRHMDLLSQLAAKDSKESSAGIYSSVSIGLLA